MSATAAFFAVRAPVRVSVAQTPKRSTACRAAAKETSVKAEDFKCPLACDASKDEHGAVVEMAKAKCVHPDRPVAKACKDCPRK
eukprot:CAMPEP_0203003886 /NCGR_PEP_ID=MMETSP1401-20130829/2087_1 /ASSEMBLY_ACC=CAM_ASM_000894 /TAXON_ID=38833 /ORGANISM="Micromonas pusilla, Strain CCAC1681" /LENGTH=83 /DNA_ID=CAMNT_0049745475 /DNA_START=55 /DNA_END=306 /DNA_ORIENTATION=+